LPEIQVSELQASQFLHSQSAPQHDHDHGLVAGFCNPIEKHPYLFIPQVSGQGS